VLSNETMIGVWFGSSNDLIYLIRGYIYIMDHVKH